MSELKSAAEKAEERMALMAQDAEKLVALVDAEQPQSQEVNPQQAQELEGFVATFYGFSPSKMMRTGSGAMPVNFRTGSLESLTADAIMYLRQSKQRSAYAEIAPALNPGKYERFQRKVIVTPEYKILVLDSTRVARYEFDMEKKDESNVESSSPEA